MGTSRLVNHAHKNNIAVCYWTINDEEKMEFLQSIGADSIITDVPDVACEVFIQPMLKKNKEAFRKYHILYLAIIYSLIPQYIAVCLFHFFVPSIILYVVGTLLLIRILLAIFYRLELGSNRISVYAQK